MSRQSTNNIHGLNVRFLFRFIYTSSSAKHNVPAKRFIFSSLVYSMSHTYTRNLKPRFSVRNKSHANIKGNYFFAANPASYTDTSCKLPDLHFEQIKDKIRRIKAQFCSQVDRRAYSMYLDAAYYFSLKNTHANILRDWASSTFLNCYYHP